MEKMCAAWSEPIWQGREINSGRRQKAIAAQGGILVNRDFRLMVKTNQVGVALTEGAPEGAREASTVQTLTPLGGYGLIAARLVPRVRARGRPPLRSADLRPRPPG
jgi:hypothetical protein